MIEKTLLITEGPFGLKGMKTTGKVTGKEGQEGKGKDFGGTGLKMGENAGRKAEEKRGHGKILFNFFFFLKS